MEARRLNEIINGMLPGDAMPIYVGAQNAGVILRKLDRQTLTYESFFTTLPTAAVTTTIGKVIAQFPNSPRLPMPADVDLVAVLCEYLPEMHILEFPDAVPQTKKAGNTQPEYRESTNPWYITEFLPSVIRNFSGDKDDVCLPETTYVTKRLGDHVLWKNADLPWRRSPVLLLLKIALHTALKDVSAAQYGYKAFIATLLDRLLSEAQATTSAAIADDVLYVMNAKIATRMSKLRHSQVVVDGFPISDIFQRIKSLSCKLDERMAAFRKEEALPIDLSPPSEAEISDGCVLSLKNSRPYLAGVISRDETLKQTSNTFDASAFEAALPTSRRLVGLSPPQSFEGQGALHEVLEAMNDISTWLASDRSSSWMDSTSVHERRDIIRSLMKCSIDVLGRFMRSGNDHNPELFSLAFLNVMDLWVILDKTATEAIPLLKEYLPELTGEPLEALLLRARCSMCRLSRIEQHFFDRKRNASSGSVYTLDPQLSYSSTFGARYAASTHELRRLRTRIEDAGKAEKRRKRVEHSELERERTELLAEAARRSCEFYTSYNRWGASYTSHSSSCTKCDLEEQARSKSIRVFEEPLPSDTHLAGLMVFELQVPPLFSLWRSVTCQLIRMFARSLDSPRRDANHILDGYADLQRSIFGAATGDPHVTLASDRKSFLVAHYNVRPLPCSEDDVLKNHGPRWWLYDRASGFLPSAMPEMDLRPHCTPALSGPYASLEWTLSGTAHTPNEVIARQSSCATQLSMHEWEAFGNLRAGNRLQWYNIVLQLDIAVLKLADPAVHTLIRQAALQAEKSSRQPCSARETHAIISDEQFAAQALDVLRRRYLTCDENWEEAWMASTLSLVGHRLHELLPLSASARTHARAFVQTDLRRVCMRWMAEILAAMRKTGPDMSSDARNDLRHRLIQVCIAGRDTYHACEDVFGDGSAVSDYLECCIVLHQQLPSDLSKLPQELRALVENDIQLSVSLLDSLQNAILNGNTGIDTAVRKIWPGFARSARTAWRQVPGTRWVTCRTSTERDRTVHVHLLDGSIQVDGASFQALPSDILSHPLYQEIFPSQYQMQILPSTMVGMTYQSQFALNDYELHFLMDGNDLIVRIRDLEGRVSEFVPQSKLKGDIPNVLLVECIAVYHALDEAQLDFVPRHKKLGWHPATATKWTLRHVATRPELVVADLGRQIICPHSALVHRLSGVFKPLEKSSLNLLVVLATSGTAAGIALTTHLPRYRLEFCFDEGGHLASKEFPHYVISASRDIGTLSGVEKLVLHSRGTFSQQRIIIPAAPIVVTARAHHPRISVELPCDPSARVEAHVFDVDALVGQVKSDGGLDSWLTLVYLHALSSSHQRDPLTDERGVDRALRMLQSASSFAFTALSPEDMNLLSQISSLTPARRFYPQHLQVMETTEWASSLSPLSQSELFAPLVTDIVTYARRRSVFDAPSAQSRLPDMVHEGEEGLRLRASQRTARFCPYADQWQMNNIAIATASTDTTFSWTARPDFATRLLQVQDIAFRVRTWDPNVDATTELWEHFTKWSDFSSEPDDFPLVRPCLHAPRSQPTIWFSLYKRCLTTSIRSHRYSLMFTLPFLAYRDALSDDLIHSIVGLAVHGERNSRAISSADAHLPRTGFKLDDGWDMSPSRVLNLEDTIRQFEVPFTQSSEYELPQRSGESGENYESRCRRAYRDNLEEQVQALVEDLRRQWPCSEPRWPYSCATRYPLLDLEKLQREVCALFCSMAHNRQLRQHASELQLILDAFPGQRSLGLRRIPSPPSSHVPTPLYVTPDILRSMATRPAPSERLMRVRIAPPVDHVIRDERPGRQQSGVHLLIDRLTTEHRFSEQYKDDLGDCAAAMATGSSSTVPLHGRTVERKHNVQIILHNDIVSALAPATAFEQALYFGGNWPSLGVRSILSCLALPRRHALRNTPWMQALTLFAESLVQLQRERRLDQLHGADFDKELSTNVGQGYDAHAYPDWLLIQLDSNVTIRAVQADIARSMMSQHNRVMQLNMGEGKSSVIIPITSTACADGENLACVVVLKPLCTQMFHLLGQRICGLANRRLFYLPFSRDTTITSSSIRDISQLFKECIEVGGILLCQPEHLLSFQLMGSSMLCDRPVDADTRALLDTQQLLADCSRYIVDESDEVFSHKYQLVYTVGSPGPLEGQPERWLIIQQVLSLINANVDAVSTAHPDGLDVESGCNAVQQFRRMRILTQAAYRHLISLCLHDIVHRNAIPLLPFRSYPSKKLDAARQFISTHDVSLEEAQELEAYSGDSYPHLLLLRGLFAHGILGLAFKEKRWRVDYGLDLSRSRLAVPYRAKDSPALRAEFGHPDVILTLTSLAYYYGGLQDAELDTAFDRLLTTDNPALRYEYWIKGLEVPQNLRTLKGINLKDASQRCNVIYPTLRRVKSVVDFYLSECVFPKEARQFEHKLTTNAWDLARSKGRPTTGFSGTNDNKYMLPTSIVQEDLPSQLHTNALVLGYVLRPENRTVICKDCDASGIIAETVQSKPHVSVILDVGAQVLELDNAEMARRWLEQDTREEVEAAVYFDSDDELYVRTRDGSVEQLRRSFYRDQLGKTLVYLDEAHTRGTDLKLPEGTRALVTLGPKLTKDKLMQGCMRMRKLGRSDGHSVLFLASCEIRTRIQESIKEPKEHLDSSDVLLWTMQETIRQTTENGALWANQGMNFDVRQAGWEAYNKSTLDSDGLARILLEREAHPLRELYGPHDVAETTDNGKEPTEGQREILKRCEQYGFSISHNSQLLEEQERELAHEKETEREIQRAPPAKPKPHCVDPMLARLVRGDIPSLTNFRTLRDCLAVTSVHQEIGLLSRSFFQGRNVVATHDFVETIELSPRASHEKDGFVRPVHWIVSTRKAPDALVLISPFEANEIMKDVRQSSDVRLHLYTPRTSSNMRAFDDMTFLITPSYITPSSAATTYAPPARTVLHELHLFAGNLFLRDEAAYREVCQMLGLYLDEIPDAMKGQVGVDGFVRSEQARAGLDIEDCRFERSPTAMFRTLVDLRRKGQGFLLTHIGQMLYGNALASDEFLNDDDVHGRPEA
ncbi:hypothetical protein BD626DRAFT_587475 [Schizophyllum amplum]|uniref:ubiquitinyl hydrolase 1 n=1 Tax=Schizophyllum amplum TaxID=97359 RepID=A0A550BUB1_9AGAR|nr:hypothetical protein BD626DRAFT_587475 [Auriculariopsis ampla]